MFNASRLSATACAIRGSICCSCTPGSTSRPVPRILKLSRYATSSRILPKAISLTSAPLPVNPDTSNPRSLPTLRISGSPIRALTVSFVSDSPGRGAHVDRSSKSRAATAALLSGATCVSAAPTGVVISDGMYSPSGLSVGRPISIGTVLATAGVSVAPCS